MRKNECWRIITISLTLFVCFLFCSQILFADSITPGTISATLDEGEAIFETKTVTLEGAPADVDIMFSFDLTASMAGVINTAKAKANEIMTAVQAALPGSSIRFGVAFYMDYPGFCEPTCDYFSDFCYGYSSYGDYAYNLDQSLTSDSTAVSNAINGLILGYGGDGPQDYTRVFYESYADSGIGWGDGVKILINFGDNVPHDCDLNEGVPGAYGTWTTGVDPGRDGISGTGDDLDLQAVLANMATNNIILMELHTTFADYTPKEYWDYWAGITGGNALLTSSSGSDLVDRIVDAVNAAVRQIDTLTLSASAGYESWLCSVTPPSYNNIDVPEGGVSFNFDINICVPLDIECGIHNFTINAVGDGAVLASQAVTIDVPCNYPPVADADGPYNGLEGSPIAFDGSGSSDPDGDMIEYRWDFDGDGTFDTGWSTSPYAENTWCDDFSDAAEC